MRIFFYLVCLIALPLLLAACSQAPETIGKEYAQKVCSCYKEASNEDFSRSVSECQEKLDKEYKEKLEAIEKDAEAGKVLRKTIVDELLVCDEDLQKSGK